MTITYLKYGKPDVERAQDDAETKIVVEQIFRTSITHIPPTASERVVRLPARLEGQMGGVFLANRSSVAVCL